MIKKLAGLLFLIVFTFGLVPGDYWKLLHNHKHIIYQTSSGAAVSAKHKICNSQNHLYDYTKSKDLFNINEVLVIQLNFSDFERHLPHPSFLNVLLRAPPSFNGILS